MRSLLQCCRRLTLTARTGCTVHVHVQPSIVQRGQRQIPSQVAAVVCATSLVPMCREFHAQKVKTSSQNTQNSACQPSKKVILAATHRTLFLCHIIDGDDPVEAFGMTTAVAASRHTQVQYRCSTPSVSTLACSQEGAPCRGTCIFARLPSYERVVDNDAALVCSDGRRAASPASHCGPPSEATNTLATPPIMS